MFRSRVSAIRCLVRAFRFGGRFRKSIFCHLPSIQSSIQSSTQPSMQSSTQSSILPSAIDNSQLYADFAVQLG